MLRHRPAVCLQQVDELRCFALFGHKVVAKTEYSCSEKRAETCNLGFGAMFIEGALAKKLL